MDLINWNECIILPNVYYFNFNKTKILDNIKPNINKYNGMRINLYNLYTIILNKLKISNSISIDELIKLYEVNMHILNFIINIYDNGEIVLLDLLKIISNPVFNNILKTDFFINNIDLSNKSSNEDIIKESWKQIINYFYNIIVYPDLEQNNLFIINPTGEEFITSFENGFKDIARFKVIDNIQNEIFNTPALSNFIYSESFVPYEAPYDVPSEAPYYNSYSYEAFEPYEVFASNEAPYEAFAPNEAPYEAFAPYEAPYEAFEPHETTNDIENVGDQDIPNEIAEPETNNTPLQTTLLNIIRNTIQYFR